VIIGKTAPKCKGPIIKDIISSFDYYNAKESDLNAGRNYSGSNGYIYQDIISIKAYNDRNSKEKIEIQEKEKRDEFMINKYNNNKTIKPNEIIKNNEINYNNKSNEINTKNNNNNNYNKNYNSQQSEINSGKDENNYISTSNEKKYDIKDYMQNVNQNINKKQEEEKPNKNKIIENNNSTPEKQQFNNNYEINRQDINIQNIQNNSNKILSNDLNRKEKNDMPIQINNNSVSKNDGVINEISIAANMNDKITKKKMKHLKFH
jgi:hypothetical protein